MGLTRTLAGFPCGSYTAESSAIGRQYGRPSTAAASSASVIIIAQYACDLRRCTQT
jgi:hypothetical protein